ncbi:unnamed protein product [Pylaiella littoralis]
MLVMLVWCRWRRSGRLGGRRGRGRERTQQRHQSLRQTAAQRRPLTSKIRLQGLPLPRHQRLRPRAGGLGAVATESKGVASIKDSDG